MVSAVLACNGSGGADGSAQLLETNDRGDAFTMSVGSDAIGNSLAVWNQDERDGQDVYARHKPVGRGWGKKVQLSARGPYAFNPSITLSRTRYGDVAVNGSGHALAVWTQLIQDDAGSRWKLMASVYTPDVGWDAPTMVPTGQQMTEYQATVALNDHGDAMVAFRSTTRFHAKACSFSLAAGWGSCHALQTDDAERGLVPGVTINNSGMAIVAWQQFKTNDNRFRMAVYTPDDGWGANRTVSGHDGVMSGSVALDDDGLALFTWYDKRYGVGDFYVRAYQDGTLYGDLPLTTNGVASSYSSPAVVFGAPGEAAILWAEPNGARIDVNVMFRTASGYTAAENIDGADETFGDSSSQRVAMNASGEVVATWAKETADGGMSVWATRHVPGAGWDEPIQLDDGKGEYVYPTGLAVDGLGNAVTLWAERAGSGRYDIWTSTF